MDYVLGIDIGTTGCKATVFEKTGKIIKQSYREYPMVTYTGTIDPENVWDMACEAVKECTRIQPIIKAICVTSFGESVVLIDDKKEVLCDSILYTDGGAVKEWKELDQKLGEEEIYRITGHISHPMYTINRLLWYKKQRPELYQKTEKFLFFSSFIIMKLGGRYVAENTQAARSMSYDVMHGCWSNEVLEAAKIDGTKLPEVVSAGEFIGRVSELAAKILGFQNIPQIIAGGQDQPCVALGMGAIQGGDAVYGLGTVECLSVVLDQYQQSEEMKKSHLVCAPHVIPGKYLTYGVLYSGGNVIKELRNRLYAVEQMNGEKQEVYDIIFQELAQKETDVIFIPHLYGAGTPSMNQQEAGTLWGLRAETERGEIIRAAVEGLSFDMKENIENMEKAGISVGHIRAAGGGAKSAAAMSLRADILDKDIFLPENVQAGTRGVFYIVAKTLGWIRDDTQISNFQTNEGRWIKPHSDSEKIYHKKYKKYLRLKCLMEDR